jgi:hypothetical protein
MADDIDKLIKWARSQGWEVRIDASGYRRFYRPDGTYAGYYPATPSKPGRRLRDIITVLRAKWPPVAASQQEGATRTAHEGGAAVNEWTVTVGAATGEHLDELTLVALAERAEQWDGTVGARGGAGSGFILISDVTTSDPIDAGAEAVDRAHQLAGSAGLEVRIVQIEVKTPELAELDAQRPDTPELLAATDVARLLGVSRQRVHQLHSERGDFPAPYARLGSGPIWTRPAIEAFGRSWTRKPGRPAKAS